MKRKFSRGLSNNLRHKERIEKAVEKERIQKEKEEKLKKEAEEYESKEHKGEEKVDVAEHEPTKSNDDKAAISDDSPLGQHAVKVEEASEVTHGSNPINELGSKEDEEAKGIDSLSREDLGREIGSRWTEKKPEQEYQDAIQH